MNAIDEACDLKAPLDWDAPIGGITLIPSSGRAADSSYRERTSLNAWAARLAPDGDRPGRSGYYGRFVAVAPTGTTGYPETITVAQLVRRAGATPDWRRVSELLGGFAYLGYHLSPPGEPATTVLQLPIAGSIPLDCLPVLRLVINSLLEEQAVHFNVTRWAPMPVRAPWCKPFVRPTGCGLDGAKLKELGETLPARRRNKKRSSKGGTAFPERAWGGLFGVYRDLVQPSSEATPAFHWAAVAACLSVLVGRSVWMEFGAARISPILHLGVVGETAQARKSSALNTAVELILNPLIESGFQDDVPLSVVSGLGTGEGYFDVLKDRPGPDGKLVTGRKALYIVHELGGLLEKGSRGEGGSIIEFILACYDGRRKHTHRTRSGGESTITDGVGVFLGASTREWLLAQLREQDLRNGLFNRLLWLSGPPAPPVPLPPAIPAADRAAFLAQVRAAVTAVAGKPMVLSDKAYSAYTNRYLADRKRKVHDDLLEAATARSDNQALRVAMLLSIAEGSNTVTAGRMRAAWEVIDLSRSVALGLVDGVRGTRKRALEHTVTHAVLRHVLEGNGHDFTRRQVFQRCKSRKVTSQQFNPVFGSLLRSGQLVESGKRGGSPTYRWVGGLPG